MRRRLPVWQGLDPRLMPAKPSLVFSERLAELILDVEAFAN
jgi:hypothetical protein